MENNYPGLFDSPENRFNLAWFRSLQNLDSEDKIHFLRTAIEGTVLEDMVDEHVISAVVNSALSAVNRAHHLLGEGGKAKDSVNRFGEMALRADVSAEEVLLSRLEIWANAEGIRLSYRGEELGEGVVGPEDGKEFFAVMDGLDGSANYLSGGDWPYGTMVAIAKGSDPTYEDFLVSGVLLPEEGMIVRGIKGIGVYVAYQGLAYELPHFGLYENYNQTKILADDYFPEAQVLLGSKRDVWPRTGSTAATIVALAIGEQVLDEDFPRMSEGWQALVDVTRKGNLEQPIVYRMITELGGVMVDKDGESIGKRKFKEWGQIEKLPVITAKSAQIAERIRQELGIAKAQG